MTIDLILKVLCFAGREIVVYVPHKNFLYCNTLFFVCFGLPCSVLRGKQVIRVFFVHT